MAPGDLHVALHGDPESVFSQIVDLLKSGSPQSLLFDRGCGINFLWFSFGPLVSRVPAAATLLSSPLSIFRIPVGGLD